jgi:cytoskeletal protein CcmA (bactofilin family)
MAQIIKHRRGLIGGVKNLTARNGELIIASGSISDLSGPFVFIGSPNAVDEGVAGAFNSVSKLYTGTAAPTITAATYGSALDGTPYYASGNKSIYILNNSNVGNTQIDLTGNIEGNTISGVTINNLQSTNVTASYVSASFIGDASGLYNVPASGVTGLELNRISDGTATASISQSNGLRVNVNTEITGTLNVNGNTSITGTFVATDGAAFINQGVISQNSNLLLTSGSHLIIQDSGNAYIAGNVYITGSEYVDNVVSRTGNSNNALHLNGGTFGAADVELTSNGNISLFSEGGNGEATINVTGSMKVTGDVTVEQDLYVSGNIHQTGSFFTQGNIILSGSINIGDNLTGDTINFGGEISSSIIPAVNNSFDLGSPSNAWNDLYVSGTAYIENINLASISVNSLALPGDLTVSGTTTLSGSVLVEDLIQGRVVLVGADGQLVDNENFLYDLVNGFTMNTSGSVNINTSGSFNLHTHDGNDIYMSSSASFDILADNDVDITAGDDLRMYANDTLSLRNYSTDEPITLITNYNGSSKTLEFDVNGNLTIPEGFTGSYLDINTQAQLASAAVEDLTDNRIVLAGVGGELEDDANFTFDGTTFKVGDGDFEVDTDGDIRTSGSLHVYGNTQISGNTSVTGAFTVASGSATMLGGDLYVSGNLQVLGSSTNVSIQSQTVDIGDNIIQVNAYSPFDRYAGLAAYDSGSSGTSGSFLWDSTNDYWLIVNSNADSSKIIGTTASTGGTGTEISLTSGTFPIATASNTIGDSLLTYSGTTLAYNTNKFTVDSTNGDTAISGNLTLSYSGGTDGGTKTSRVTFRNSSNVLGYVSTTETTNELDGILGYNHSSGVLEFSTLIDGGTY